MTEEVAVTLLSSIENDRFVVICGAGLSTPAPSNLPLAAELAAVCKERHLTENGVHIPDEHCADMEAMAAYFYMNPPLWNSFTERWIPWGKFNRHPNSGHEAIADFLKTGVSAFVVSTNPDRLIERAADRLGEPAFRAVVDADDLQSAPTRHERLLKLHGCGDRDPRHTVWSRLQLDGERVQARIGALTTWLRANLPGKDLLIVGFWTDWEYLNAVLLASLNDASPRSVVLVNTANAGDLQQKSPELWEWANKAIFSHVAQSAESFLDELRRRFSRQFFVKVLSLGVPAYQKRFAGEPPDPDAVRPDMTTHDLYALRRDICGVPSTEMPGLKEPGESHSLIGCLHLGLMAVGALLEGSFYNWRERTLRLVNGVGQVLSLVRARFADESPVMVVDRAICVGADDDGGAPPHLLRPGAVGDIVRHTQSAAWETHDALTDELREAIE